MRTGILTFHYGDNFGAILQCASLFKAIKEMGHEVDVIDYLPKMRPSPPVWTGWGFRGPQFWMNVHQRACQIINAPRMHRKFDDFRARNLTFSPECRTMAEFEKVISTYDAIVVGSDQVWNWVYSFVGDPYFLHQLNYGGRRVSYAACCGNRHTLPQDKSAYYGEAVRNFDFVSVRNETTQEWVREAAGIEPVTVCDPTMLTSAEHFPPAARQLPYEKFLLVYVIGSPIDCGHERALAEIQKARGKMPIVVVAATCSNPQKYPYADHVIWDASPNEWVDLFRKAEFVYTDSFHGVMFSTKFHRPFFAYYREKMRAHRLLDTGSRLGVMNQIAGSLAEAKDKGSFEHPIDFAGVESRMESMKKQSLEFLRKALS
jgi:hypothetical protein